MRKRKSSINKKEYISVMSLKPGEADLVRQKYPGRVPVVIQKAPNAKNDLPDLPKKKYLVPNDITVGNFIYIIRRQIHLSPEKAIYLFVNNTLPMSSMSMRQLYEHYKKDDGIVYIYYTSESTFG